MSNRIIEIFERNARENRGYYGFQGSKSDYKKYEKSGKKQITKNGTKFAVIPASSEKYKIVKNSDGTSKKIITRQAQSEKLIPINDIETRSKDLSGGANQRDLMSRIIHNSLSNNEVKFHKKAISVLKHISKPGRFFANKPHGSIVDTAGSVIAGDPILGTGARSAASFISGVSDTKIKDVISKLRKHNDTHSSFWKNADTELKDPKFMKGELLKRRKYGDLLLGKHSSRASEIEDIPKDQEELELTRHVRDKSAFGKVKFKLKQNKTISRLLNTPKGDALNRITTIAVSGLPEMAYDVGRHVGSSISPNLSHSTKQKLKRNALRHSSAIKRAIGRWFEKSNKPHPESIPV